MAFVTAALEKQPRFSSVVLGSGEARRIAALEIGRIHEARSDES